MAFEVVIFVLHDASKEAFESFGVFYKVFVKIVHSYFGWASNLFVNARHTETALFVGDSLFAVVDYFRIDKYAFSCFDFREILFHWRSVNHE